MIHAYKMNGFNIVLDVLSGSIHSVDEVAYDIITRYESRTQQEIVDEMLEKYHAVPEITLDEINDVFSDIEELKAGGKLFSEDSFDSGESVKRKRKRVIKALCLHIAHDCNMACQYCFAGKGEYHGDRALMSFETGKKALDFLLSNSGTRRNLEVDFFGGEPLMNFEVIKQLVAYGREQEKSRNKKFRFTLTTNGVLLNDEVMEFANREMSNVVLSIDGRKEVNDHMRLLHNGKSSYDLILPKFIKMAESRNQENYYIRGTYTHSNTDFASDILHIADLGFKQISMEPVVAPPEEAYAIKQADVPVLCAEYERLAVEMLRRADKGSGFTFYHYMIDLEGGPCIVKRVSGCGVGSEYLAVTPSGDFYPCHQFVGNESFLMGNVTDGITNAGLQEQFGQLNIYAKEECRDCFARMYCGGGCAANAYHMSGRIDDVYEIGCQLHKKRIECAIMIKVAEALKDQSVTTE